MTGILDISAVLLELGLTSSPTEVQRAVIMSSIARAEAAVRRHLKYDPCSAERTEFYPQQSYSPISQELGVWEASDTEAYIRNVNSGASEVLLVRHLPIRIISALYVDYDGRSGARSGAFGSGTLKTEGSDFWANYDQLDSSGAKLCRDGMLRSHGLWPSEPGCVKIVYTAGYSAAELAGQDTVIDASPIMEATLIEATRRARRSLAKAHSSRLGIVAGTIGSESLGDYSYSITPDKGMDFGAMSLSGEATELLSDFVNFGFQLAS